MWPAYAVPGDDVDLWQCRGFLRTRTEVAAKLAKPMEEDGHLLSTRYGRLSVPAGEEDLITTFLRQDGEWAFLEAEFLGGQLPRHPRVLDIGAYLGTFTLGLTQVNPPSFACLVEGNPASVPYLARNVAANLHCPYEVLGAVVVASGRSIAAARGDPSNRGSTSFCADTPGTTLELGPLDTISFEELIKKYDTFDLVKADVEGMEEQLLTSYPALLKDESTLLWVECNEAPKSLSLARILLDTGRPLSYFAWPSHNPRNYLGRCDPIFPFAYEAGLLMGARAPRLGDTHRAAGCILKPIDSLESLRQIMWLTPRWAPREWLDLPPQEIVGIAGHLQSGQRYEDFLITPTPQTDSPDSTVELGLRLAQFRIRQLEDKVAELSALQLQQVPPRSQT